MASVDVPVPILMQAERRGQLESLLPPWVRVRELAGGRYVYVVLPLEYAAQVGLRINSMPAPPAPFDPELLQRCIERARRDSTPCVTPPWTLAVVELGGPILPQAITAPNADVYRRLHDCLPGLCPDVDAFKCNRSEVWLWRAVVYGLDQARRPIPRASKRDVAADRAANNGQQTGCVYVRRHRGTPDGRRVAFEYDELLKLRRRPLLMFDAEQVNFDLPPDLPVFAMKICV
jgi:hypothetical protein